MKKNYIISEQQNDRIMEFIKQVGNTYTSKPYITKTDVEVEYDQNGSYYVIHPLFFYEIDAPSESQIIQRTVKLEKHQLADFIETVVGVPVHSASARIKKIDNR